MTDTSSQPFNVLILCTGNSARSILGEALVTKLGNGKMVGYSAGSFPNGRVNPHALKLLNKLDYVAEGFRSKSWDEFSAPDAPHIDLVITVCDNAANETCPVWPGGPAKVHWGLPDPAGVTGSEEDIDRAFAETYAELEKCITVLAALPVRSMDKQALKDKLMALAAPSTAFEQA